jgi:hypothetical protein
MVLLGRAALVKAALKLEGIFASAGLPAEAKNFRAAARQLQRKQPVSREIFLAVWRDARNTHCGIVFNETDRWDMDTDTEWVPDEGFTAT